MPEVNSSPNCPSRCSQRPVLTDHLYGKEPVSKGTDLLLCLRPVTGVDSDWNRALLLEHLSHGTITFSRSKVLSGLNSLYLILYWIMTWVSFHCSFTQGHIHLQMLTV